MSATRIRSSSTRAPTTLPRSSGGPSSGQRLDLAPRKQGFLTVLSPVKCDALPGLEKLLESEGRKIDTHSFEDVRTLHFLRWVVLAEAERDAADSPRECQDGPQCECRPALVFSTNYDGRVEDHVEELVTKRNSLFNNIYGHCADWTPGTDLSAYLLDRRVAAGAAYNGALYRTRELIEAERYLSDIINGILDRHTHGGGLDVRSTLQEELFERARSGDETLRALLRDPPHRSFWKRIPRIWHRWRHALALMVFRILAAATVFVTVAAAVLALALPTVAWIALRGVASTIPGWALVLQLGWLVYLVSIPILGWRGTVGSAGSLEDRARHFLMIPWRLLRKALKAIRWAFRSVSWVARWLWEVMRILGAGFRTALGRLLSTISPPGGFFRSLIRLIGFVLEQLVRPLELADIDRLMEGEDPGGQSCRVKRVDDYVLRELEDLQLQNQLTLLNRVKAGPVRMRVLNRSLRVANFVARKIYTQWEHLGGIRTIHFAHWAVLEDRRQLLFVSNYDGTWDQYLDAFTIDQTFFGLNMIWKNVVGFHRPDHYFFGGPNDPKQRTWFKHWSRRCQLPTQVWYSAYPSLSAIEITRNADVREGLFGWMSPEETQAWLTKL